MYTVMNLQCPYNGWNLLTGGDISSLRKGTVLRELVGWVGEWVGGLVSGWMGGWMGEWVGGWVS